jgi:hypothetical protein
MSDRAYTRFSIPLSVLANPAMVEVVRCAFGLTAAEFQQIILAEPVPDEADGFYGTTVRLVDGRPCLVIEDSNDNYGGSHTEQALMRSGMPFLQVNAAGDEYGPTATAFDGTVSETIRLSHDLEPVIGIGVIDGQVTLERQEIRDFEHYCQVRRSVLLWPALAA